MIKPKEFSHEKWSQWEDSIYNYFPPREKNCGVLLSYFIRKDTPSTKDIENRNVQIIYQEIIVGNIFTIDSMKVLYVLREPTLVTDSETWIKGIKCGRKSIQEIQAHYYGAPVGAQRKKVARADPKKIFYKNETNFTFEKYVTKIKGIFNVLEKYGVTLHEDQMVKHILDKIISPNKELKIEVKICR